MDDRRGTMRVQTHIKAIITAGDLHEACTITDLSDIGAKLRVRPDLLMPEVVCLQASEIGLLKSGRVIWRRNATAGLRFTC